MAALYWRYKKKGRWTWTRVKLYPGMSMQNVIDDLDYYSLIYPLEEE